MTNFAARRLACCLVTLAAVANVLPAAAGSIEFTRRFSRARVDALNGDFQDNQFQGESLNFFGEGRFFAELAEISDNLGVPSFAETTLTLDETVTTTPTTLEVESSLQTSRIAIGFPNAQAQTEAEFRLELDFLVIGNPAYFTFEETATNGPLLNRSLSRTDGFAVFPTPPLTSSAGLLPPGSYLFTFRWSDVRRVGSESVMVEDGSSSYQFRFRLESIPEPTGASLAAGLTGIAITVWRARARRATQKK